MEIKNKKEILVEISLTEILNCPTLLEAKIYIRQKLKTAGIPIKGMLTDRGLASGKLTYSQNFIDHKLVYFWQEI